MMTAASSEKWNILLNSDIGLYLIIIYDITQMTKDTLFFSYFFFQTNYICELLFPDIDDKLIYIITELIMTLEMYRRVFVTEAVVCHRCVSWSSVATANVVYQWNNSGGTRHVVKVEIPVLQ